MKKQEEKETVSMSTKIAMLKQEIRETVKKMNNKPSYERLTTLSRDLNKKLNLLNRYERSKAATII